MSLKQELFECLQVFGLGLIWVLAAPLHALWAILKALYQKATKRRQ